MRGLSPREIKRLMKKMALEMEELSDVEMAILEMADKRLVVENPQVMMLRLPGQTVIQIIGEVREEEKKEEAEEIEIPEEDIQLVAAEAGVSIEEARRALEESGGDLARAIMLLEMRRSSGEG